MERLSITDNDLRLRLIELGDAPGPVTTTTRQVYLNRLNRLVKLKGTSVNDGRRAKRDSGDDDNTTSNVGSFLALERWTHELSTYEVMEKEAFESYTNADPTRQRPRERGGLNKVFFDYLLLDSRVTKDLPHRAVTGLCASELWSTFFSAIFYIGKGKSGRPYSHLYDAFRVWVSPGRISCDEKIQRILDIWNDGCGVICLHVFHNTMSEEAFTREAVMIEAVGLGRLTNRQIGKCYGSVAHWDTRRKRLLGRYLLYKAWRILMYEGERQIFPEHL